MKHFAHIAFAWIILSVSAVAQRPNSSTLSFGIPILWGVQPTDPGVSKAPLGLTGSVDNASSSSFSAHFNQFVPVKSSTDLSIGLDLYTFDRSFGNTSYQASGMIPSVGLIQWFGKGKETGTESRFGAGVSLGAGSFRTQVKAGSQKELLSFGDANATWGATSLPLSASALYQLPLKSGQKVHMGLKYTYLAGDAGIDGYRPDNASGFAGDHLVTANIGFAFAGKTKDSDKKVSDADKVKADQIAAAVQTKP
jgi:hypothetical protein